MSKPPSFNSTASTLAAITLHGIACCRQVVWTHDDSRLVAAVSDNTIRVWNAASGALIHLLKEHTQQVQVLETHPHDRRLAMTAGYDGKVLLWDIEAGRCLKHMNTVYTFPGNAEGMQPWR